MLSVASTRRGAKVDLTFDPMTQNPLLIINNLPVKFENYRTKTVVCIIPTRLHTMIHRVPKLTSNFDPMIQNQKGPPLIIRNLHVKFESEQTKKCSLYRVHKVLYNECQIWPWPLTSCPKINRVPLLIINKLHVKFERDRTKTVVCNIPAKFYTQQQSAKVDLWPHDQKLIRFLPSSSTTYMWSLKVIGQKL